MKTFEYYLEQAQESPQSIDENWSRFFKEAKIKGAVGLIDIEDEFTTKQIQKVKDSIEKLNHFYVSDGVFFGSKEPLDIKNAEFEISKVSKAKVLSELKYHDRDALDIKDKGTNLSKEKLKEVYTHELTKWPRESSQYKQVKKQLEELKD
jgi:hypothetical protein